MAVEVKDKLVTVESAKVIHDSLNEKIEAHANQTGNAHGLTCTQLGAVPTTRTINGKALSADISLSASDVGAATSGHTHTVDEALSGSSENPVQNKVVSAAISQLSAEIVKTTSPYNLLDNSDFRNPVNQRGATEYSGAVYGIDRWIGHKDLTVSVEDDGIVLSAGSTTANLNHNLDDAVSESMRGKIYTAVVCEDDNTVTFGTFTFLENDVTTNTGMPITVLSSGTGISNYYLAAYKIGTTQRMQLRINVRAGCTQKFKWAALYEGEYTAETLPTYHPKGYGAELVECQRYYIRYNASSNMQFAAGGSNGSQAYFPVHLPVNMRGTMSLEYNNVNIYPYKSGQSVAISTFRIEVRASSNNALVLMGVHESGALSSGQAACIRIATDGYIAFSADL